MPRVTIIIPAYNAAAFLHDALNSVLRQTYSDWEVVLIDDGSTDNTRTLVNSYQESFNGKLKYIYQTNRGLPAARNTGIQNAHGEFIALLDADDVWLEERLERGVALMDGNPGLGLVHAKVARINVTGDIIERPPAPSRKYLSGMIAHHIYTRRAHLLCPTILFRKRCFDVVGPFDESMCATEDRDMWFRIARLYPVAYIEDVLAHYRISASSMSRNLERMLKWQMFFLEKHRPAGFYGSVLMHQALGNLYRERGDASFKSADLKQSIRWYLRSVGCNPLSFINLATLLRAFGEPLLARMRSNNRRVSPTATL
jgi:glycosyltransferase involved in cell wall biosynthesis